MICYMDENFMHHFNFFVFILLLTVKGVDLFFEYPMNGMGENYIYNVVNAPIQVSYSAGLRPTPIVHCDWLGILAQNLGQGYRLVEIFMDETETTQVVSSFAAEIVLKQE